MNPAEEKKPQRRGSFELRMVGDYAFDEVASSLQKSIRRNQPYEAAYWAYCLHASGYFRYVWKRLSVVASEDIGNGNPMAIVVVNALRQSYEAVIDSKNRNRGDALLFIFQAVLYLCRSEKLREADTLVNLITKEFQQGKRLEIQEHSIDPHTERGRELHGRWGEGSDEENAERARKWHEIWSYVTPASEKPDEFLLRMKELDGLH
jgi:replication-associated recombination protein RarA